MILILSLLFLFLAISSHSVAEERQSNIPYREFSTFYTRTLKTLWAGTYHDNPAYWTTDHITSGLIGRGKEYGGGPNNVTYFAIFKPMASDFAMLDGMDELVKINVEVDLSKHTDSSDPSITEFMLVHSVLQDPPDPDTWDPNTVSGLLYDGVSQWSDYPPKNAVTMGPYVYPETSQIQTPYRYGMTYNACGWGKVVQANSVQEDFFRCGMWFQASNFAPYEPDGAGEYYYVYLSPVLLRAYFFNAVVNSLSRYWMDESGGVEVVITGLGFNIPDVEIEEGGWSGCGPWNDEVDEIVFEGLSGQGDYKLNRSSDFIIDSNSQISIPSMQAMAPGYYLIKIRKYNCLAEPWGYIESYAGEWLSDGDGKCEWQGASKRFVFQVGTPDFGELINDSIQASSGSDSCDECEGTLEAGYPQYDGPPIDIYKDYMTIQNKSDSTLTIPIYAVLPTLTDGVYAVTDPLVINPPAHGYGSPPDTYWEYSFTSNHGKTSGVTMDSMPPDEKITLIWGFDPNENPFEFWVDLYSAGSKGKFRLGRFDLTDAPKERATVSSVDGDIYVVDDGTAEIYTGSSSGTFVLANRFVMLSSVSLEKALFYTSGSAAGDWVEVIIYEDPSGAAPVPDPSMEVWRTSFVLGAGGFQSVPSAGCPTLNPDGVADAAFFVAVANRTERIYSLGIDLTGPYAGASYVSTDGGTTFVPLSSIPIIDGNAMIRAKGVQAQPCFIGVVM